ncbi:hypothetical protein K2Z84_01855, partial [Candidatus Binatia bacterium]|nr:hypothetical protein [Candidatus Binatia bacterium]
MRTSRNIAVATRVAALLVFAVGVLPRSTTYVHDHADSGRAHVHAWDGTRTDDIRQLIDDARGDTHEHPHVHPHEHGAELAHAHGEPARTIAPARRT